MLLERSTRPTPFCPLILGLLETYHNIIKCSRLASGLYLVYRLLTVILLTSFLLYQLPTLLCFYKYAYDRLSDVVVDPTFLGPQPVK